VAATRKYFMDLVADEEVDLLITVCDRIFANVTER
jgi:hypothetical protein